jgi:hypothetical protein
MKGPMRWGMLAAAILGLMAATAGPGRAGTIVGFEYAGRGGPDFGGLIATGTGTFSFANGLSTVGLADLTSFTFNMEENTPNTATFGLADLTSFSASLGAGPTLTSLALETDSVQGSNPETEPRRFAVSSLNAGDAFTYYVFIGFSFSLTSGTVTITSVRPTTVPEPSSVVLAVLGTLVAAGGWAGGRMARAAA